MNLNTTKSSTQRRQPAKPASRYRWPHPLWLWLAAALLLLLALAFWSFSAAAQNQRTVDTIKAALSAQPDAKRGKALYAHRCASCHGRKGYGVDESMTPALAGQVAAYTIKQLVDAGEGDRKIGAMHRTLATPELLDPTLLASVAAYIATLPVNQHPQTGSGEQLAEGMKIYAAACVGCHGSDGGGTPARFVPALRGQHYAYLLTQMRQLAANHRYGASPSVVQLLESLSLEQLMGVADIASRLSDPRPLPPGVVRVIEPGALEYR